MPSVTGQATGQPAATARPDAPVPLPEINLAVLSEHNARLGDFDVPAQLRTLHAARGGEGAVQLPCFRMIEAINCRLAKDLEARGIEGTYLDRVLVAFIAYVLHWRNSTSLEVAWYDYQQDRLA
ncbi:hypothetical protein BDW68DRAFT_171495 [Aspergillus falconensis]